MAQALIMNNQQNRIIYSPYISSWSSDIMDMYSYPNSSASNGYKQGAIGIVNIIDNSITWKSFVIKKENFTLTYYAFENGIININRIREFYVALRQ